MDNPLMFRTIPAESGRYVSVRTDRVRPMGDFWGGLGAVLGKATDKFVDAALPKLIDEVLFDDQPVMQASQSGWQQVPGRPGVYITAAGQIVDASGRTVTTTNAQGIGGSANYVPWIIGGVAVAGLIFILANRRKN